MILAKRDQASPTQTPIKEESTMYVEQLKSGRWAVCEDDSTIIETAASKLAAIREMNYIRQSRREIENIDATTAAYHEWRNRE